MGRNKLDLAGQIHQMKSQGIRFERMTEQEAEEYLSHSSYYFKVKAYAANYHKFHGLFQQLDFAYLAELSDLDRLLRKLVLSMTLDVEHFLKVQMLADFNRDPQEDGYEIVQALYEREPYLRRSTVDKAENTICELLVNKYGGDFAIWNIVEVLSFGEFSKLYELYYDRHPSPESLVRLLGPIKALRNAGAHNNCMLHHLTWHGDKDFKPDREVKSYLLRMTDIGPVECAKAMSYPIVHDITVLLYAFDRVVRDDDVKQESFHLLDRFLSRRALRHRDYFASNETIRAQYRFMKKVVDHFCQKNPFEE